MAGQFLKMTAGSVVAGDTLVVLGANGRPLASSMRVESVEAAPDGSVRLRLGVDGMATSGFQPQADLLIFRGGDLRDVEETPLLPLQEAYLRGAGLGDREISRMNALGGYQKATEDAGFMLSIQDVMDAFFAKRSVDVRNALRQLGWEGTHGVTLTKNDESGEAMRLGVSAVKSAGSANVMAMSYVVSPVSRFEVPGVGFFDDLSMGPMAVALQAHTLACDYLVLNEKMPTILERYGHLLREMGSPVVRGADFAKAIEASMGVGYSLDYSVKMALSLLPVEFKIAPESITMAFDANDAAVYRVGPGGALEDQVLKAPDDEDLTAFLPAL